MDSIDRNKTGEYGQPSNLSNSTSVILECGDYLNHVTAMIDSDPTGTADVVRFDRHIAYVINNYVVPSISLFGIAGNVLNLIVLTHKQLQCSMKSMERSYNSGLVALAVSDLLFCLLYFLLTFVENKIFYTPKDSLVMLYYATYKEPLINIFLFSSTWLTMVVAVGRYIAICRPLQAREFINLRATRVFISSVFAGSVLINFPRFLHYRLTFFACEQLQLPVRPETDDCACYYAQKISGDLYRNESFKFAYNIIWATVAIFGPLVVLILCNVCLMRALRQSYAMQKLHRANHHFQNSDYHITPTLIALIVLFVTLVGPSEVLTFIKDQVIKSDTGMNRVFMTANEVTNCLLLVNFAVNVVLYSIINVQFRRVVKNLVCCIGFRRRNSAFNSSLRKSERNRATGQVSEVETEI